MLAEIAAYPELQEQTAAATEGLEAREMLERARAAFPGADLRLSRLEDPLPEGPFDLVVTALAVHHLDGDGKRDLFRRVIEVLRPGGRFVLADVVVPEREEDVVTPIDWVMDLPDRLDDQVEWLRAAGLDAEPVWSCKDLAVVRATRPTPSG